MRVNREGTSSESYTVELTYNKAKHAGGTFNDKEVAARVYDKLALKYHGEFARLNFEEDRSTALSYVPPKHSDVTRGPSRTGYTGVYLNKATGKFYAQIVRNNKRETIKTGFNTAHEANSYRRSHLLCKAPTT